MSVTAFRGLLAKELRLLRTMFFIVLFYNLAVNGLGVLAPFAFFGFYLVISQVIYLPVFLFASLRTESEQLHQWLYNPQSMKLLLGTKLLSGCILYFLFMILNGVYLILGPFISPNRLMGTTPFLGATCFKMFLISLTLSMCMLVCWSIFQWLKSWIPKGRFFVFIAVLLLFLYTLSKIPALVFFSHGFLYCFGISVFFFLLSSYLLDKRVEV